MNVPAEREADDELQRLASYLDRISAVDDFRTLNHRRWERYLRDGKLTIGYLSGLPAGHVTYDLVGSILRFHLDKHLRVYWCTGASMGAYHGGTVGLKVPGGARYAVWPKGSQ